MAKLDPIVSEFATTEEAEAYDVWFRKKVQEALADPRPPIPHEEVVRQVKATIERNRKKRAALNGPHPTPLPEAGFKVGGDQAV